MEHWESSNKKEQERIQIKFKLLNKFKYNFVNFLDGVWEGIIIEKHSYIHEIYYIKTITLKWKLIFIFFGDWFLCKIIWSWGIK